MGDGNPSIGERPRGVSSNIPQHVIDDIQGRFDKHWQRVILATAYPETANNVNWIMRKK